jgi:hypothetical protein
MCRFILFSNRQRLSQFSFVQSSGTQTIDERRSSATFPAFPILFVFRLLELLATTHNKFRELEREAFYGLFFFISFSFLLSHLLSMDWRGLLLRPWHWKLFLISHHIESRVFVVLRRVFSSFQSLQSSPCTKKRRSFNFQRIELVKIFRRS